MAPQNHFQVPNVQFRVLIIGRANAGKTSILQRVCDTTESPKIFRLDKQGQRSQIQLEPSIERGLHDIDDELVFEKHDGYIFHDSRGFEAGSEEELKIVQNFVRHKSREKRLKDRLHAIWFCIPMDNDRPSLDLHLFHNICPDKNVPVIALFTKYEQFKCDIKIKLEDEHKETDIDAEVKSAFEEHYLASLGGSQAPRFVCLEKMHKGGQRCTDLIALTANSLSSGVVTLMLVAVQKDNLEVSIHHAVKQAKDKFGEGQGSTGAVIEGCLAAFPWMWYFDKGQELDFIEQELGQPKQQELKKKLSKLQSFVSKWRLSISNQNAHHIMIVTIIILEYACRVRASSPGSTRAKALDKAYSQYKRSDNHKVVKETFPNSPNKYSIPQFTEFILDHRLCLRT